MAALNYKKYPALWFSALFSAGLLLGWAFRLMFNPEWLIIPAIILLILSCTAYLYYKKYFILFTIPLIIISGMAYMQSRLNYFSPDHLINLSQINQTTSFCGVVSEAHYRIGKSDRYTLQCDTVWIDSAAFPVNGKILIDMPLRSRRLKPGAQLKIIGKPIRPNLPDNPGAFNYRHFLQLGGVFYYYRIQETSQIIVALQPRGYFIQRRLLQPIRDRLRLTIDKHIHPPARDVIKALILGERQDLNMEILEDFQRSGVIHVLAISGLHAGFILLIFMLFFSFLRFSYRNRVIASLICLWLFVALVNFKTPVIRASFMATLYFISQLSQRQVHPLNIMGLAALFILIFDPPQILTLGFQFSFAAVGGIIYGYPRLSRWLAPKRWQSAPGRWLDKWVRQPLLVSLAAVLVTAPLTWYHFGVLQTGALLLNIIIIPFIFAYIILIFIYLTVSAFPVFPLDGLAWLLENSFNYVYGLIHWFSSLPFVQIRMGTPTVLVMLLSFIIVFLAYHRRWFYLVSAIIIVYFLQVGFPFNPDPNPLRVTFVSVGQGDGSIIEFPNGKVMVVDGGDRKFSFDAGKRYMGVVLNHYNIKRINYLVGSHGHSDHIGGLLHILQTFEVDTLVLSAYSYQSKLYQQLLDEAFRNGVPVVRRGRGAMLYPDSLCRVYVLHPDKEHQKAMSFSGHEVNNSSLVLKIIYGYTGFLLTGDLEKEAEPCLLDYGKLLRSNVLKAGHHGSVTSSFQPFLNLVQPDFAVISVGRRNRFFHPSRKTVTRLQNNGSLVIRTDRLGAVVIESDGEEVRLINWRKD